VPDVLAGIISLVVAACCALAAGRLLGWLPSPEEEPEVRFIELDSRRFRLILFGLAFGCGWLALALTSPTVWPIWAPLAGLGALLGLIDAKTTFLPLRLHYLTLALVVLGVLASAWWRGQWQPLALGATGAAVALALYAVVWRVSSGELGFGDVRLAGLLGLAAGATSYSALLWCFLLGSAVGAIWAVVVRLRGRKAFPYGPSMLLGAPLALIVTAFIR
jgi:leader peptidase (prepilin peptidase) / N-methyltransferase